MIMIAKQVDCHARLAHTGIDTVPKALPLVTGLTGKTVTKTFTCDTCLEHKATLVSLKLENLNIHRNRDVLYLVHSDVFGHVHIPSVGE